MASIRFRLTRGQRLLVDRRRRGETQHEAAERHGTSHRRYCLWERDEIPGPFVKIYSLLPHEKYFLLRREAGIRQKDLADELGICRNWLIAMETGLIPCPQLEEYWKGRT